MKTNYLLLATLCAVFAATHGCGGPSVAPLAPSSVEVTSFSPQGRLEDPETPLRFQFDKPIVPLHLVGAPLDEVPVETVPGLNLSGAWEDRQTLVVRVRQKMAPSTTYTVKLTGDLAEAAASGEFSFVYKPLKVTEVFGVDPRAASRDERFGLRFNQPVEAEQLGRNCALEGEGDLIPVFPADEALVGDEMILAPMRAMEQGSHYTLVCHDLMGAGGDTPMEKPYELELTTYAEFAIDDHGPTGDDHWSDEVEITIEFATPVELSRVAESLSSVPGIKGLGEGTMSNGQTRYVTVVDLKSTTSYAVEVARTLTDVYGQRGERKLRFNFTTGHPRPRLVMETGIFAVEAKNEGGTYPVWTRNLSGYDVDCARVKDSDVVSLLTGYMNYDPWYDAGDNRDLEWKKLGLKKKTTRLKVKESKDKWHLERLALPKICGGRADKGLFLAEVRSKELVLDEDRPWSYRPRQRVLANVTDMGVLLKAGSASGLVWVTSLESGEPVSGAQVDIYTPRGEKAFSGTTRADGVLLIPGADQLLKQGGAGDKDDVDEYGYDEYDTWRARRLIAVVRNGSDMAVVDGNWANGIAVWNFGVPSDHRGGEKRVRGFILSDRGIYRPKEKVHFKGLVREIELGAAPSVPKKKRVSVTVEDARGAVVMDKAVRMSRFGGFSFDLQLGESAALGDYYVTARSNGKTFRETFIVEEFRPVTYELDLSSAGRHARLGDKIELTMTADYLFGAPVAGAQVEWSAMRRQHAVRFPGYSQYTFGDDAAGGFGYWWWYDDDYHGTDYVTDGAGETDSEGRFNFSVIDEDGSFGEPQDYIIQVTAQDQTGETISKSSVVTAHETDVYLGLHSQEYVQAVDMPFSVNTVALSPKGERVALKATLSYVRLRQVCKRERRGYRSYSTCETVNEQVWSQKIDIPATGSGTERIMPRTPGEYAIRLEGKDSRGNKVQASSMVWILGKGQAFWSGDESVRMSLIASKTSYRAGETARLVPRSSLGPSTALVTLERNGIIDAFVKKMGTSGDGVEIEMTDAYAPNVFASVAMIKGRTGAGDRNRPRFQMGITELKVSDAQSRLAVEISTRKATYEPGEKVEGTIRIKSADGSPVVAEVALSVADEGVLQLIGYKTPDPMASFYKAWGLGVDNGTNLNRISRLNDPRAIDPDEGGDSGDGGGPDVRSRFVSSAFWKPSIVTDERGEATFEFTAPDNLSAFRLMAVAADDGSRFGNGDERITIAKRLMARPLLPRFLSSGDLVRLGVEVRNNTGAAGTASVALSVRGLKAKRKNKKVKLAAGESAVVRFDATVREAKRAVVKYDVRLGDAGDAVKVALPINRPLVRDTRTLSKGPIDRQVKVPIRYGDDLLAADSALEISIDRTGMSQLEPGLKYLIEYPYGCLEQTLSRLIPLMKVEDLARSANFRELRGPRLKRFISAGLEKVVRHQHEDGQFSLWPGGRVYPHLTVYAMYGMNEARRAGIAVDDLALERGTRALKSWIASGSNGVVGKDPGASGTLAQGAYVLAELGSPDTGLTARLFEVRAGLPIYAQGFLLSAMASGGEKGERFDTLLEELTEQLVVKDGAASVEETLPGLSRYMSSDTRSTAIVLSAILRAKPSSEMIPRLAEGLLRRQRPSGAWRSTQDNLYALVALADYARTMADGSTSVTVMVNGKKVVGKKLRGHDVVSLRLPLTGVDEGSLSIEADGPVRHVVRLTEARRDDYGSPVSRGFQVEREYLNPETNKSMTSFSIGELVRVKVTVSTPKDRAYVAVEDPLPAGFEAVNTSFATSASDPLDRGNHNRYYDPWSWRPGWTFVELRDDRVLAFVDELRDGKIVLEYLARASVAGTYTAAPATAQEMYRPEVNGRTTNITVKVEVPR